MDGAADSDSSAGSPLTSSRGRGQSGGGFLSMRLLDSDSDDADYNMAADTTTSDDSFDSGGCHADESSNGSDGDEGDTSLHKVRDDAAARRPWIREWSTDDDDDEDEVDAGLEKEQEMKDMKQEEAFLFVNIVYNIGFNLL